jgi:hypothetical protein
MLEAHQQEHVVRDDRDRCREFGAILSEQVLDGVEAPLGYGLYHFLYCLLPLPSEAIR